MNEDQMLTSIAVYAALAKLDPADRQMIMLIYRIEQPDDWGELPWPPTYQDIGIYIGTKYEGKPLSEAAIRYRRDALFGMWKGTRGGLRRGPRETDV